MRIEIISGSARPQSLTKRVALHLHDRLSRNHRLDAGLITMDEHHLPYVEHIWNRPEDAPSTHTHIARRIFDVHGIILVTPEYNGSYSAALKTFLDHFPKHERKVFGIVSASPGGLGGIRAALQLQQLVFAIAGIGVPRMLVVPDVEGKFDERGKLLDTRFDSAVNAFTKDFIWLTRALHGNSVPQMVA